MSDTGPSALEKRIERFEELLEELKGSTREVHEALQQVKYERKEIERLLSSKEIKTLVEDRVNQVVKTELERIGPEVRKQTNLIYAKVGQQIDKLIDLSLGKEFSTRNGRDDLRPRLAAKMKEWIREIVEEA